MDNDNLEIFFQKYRQYKRPYHWDQCSNNVKTINPYIKARYEIIIDCIRDLSRANKYKILDYGCGDGALSGMIARMGHDIYGVDTVPLAVEFAKQKFKENRLNGKFSVIEGYYSKIEDAFCDIVVCADVIEHVQDPLALLQEIKRIMRKDGFLIISTPLKFIEKPIDKMHIREWFRQEFEDLCGSIFEKPIKTIISHPLIWYELYTMRKRYLDTLIRYFINTLSIFGINVFKKTGGNAWKCYNMQTLVLQKK